MKAQQGSIAATNGAAINLRNLLWLLSLSLFLLLSSSQGCARINLPAIDPNGSRIFLPFPNTTQLNVPRVNTGNGQGGIFPTPAYQAPAIPPPCVEANGVCSAFGNRKSLCSRLQQCFDSPGKTGEIRLSPLRVAAPVGGEVVLLAGICGEKGRLVKRQPLEWMLSPESVGTFIDIGNDRTSTLANLLHPAEPKIEKLDVDFARGRTSSKPTVITRGSPNCEDDIALREGQTWLSISSPSEGVSRVTVLAPDSEIWDRRHQTATIYWVDGQWEFPNSPPAQPSGTPIQLVTRVTRAEQLVPAEGWSVRYTIVDPNIATFNPPTGSNEATVRVDQNGQALVNIISQQDARGTTPVIIDVIKPAEPSDNLPELTLGRGQAFVSYSAPGLTLEVFGPEVGAVGEQLTYTAILGNPGDVDAENVSLVLTKPADWKFIGSSYDASQNTNNQYRWDQGVLGANQQFEVSMILEARQAEVYEVQFDGVAAGGLSDQKLLRTEIISPQVDVRFEPLNGVAEAEVGNTIPFKIDVYNMGRQTLTDLKLDIESTDGMPEFNSGENTVQQTISMLQPGETNSNIGVTFRVQQQGPQSARLRVSIGDKLLAEKTVSVQGLPEREKTPEIGAEIEIFPVPYYPSFSTPTDTLQVGQKYAARIRATNPGEVKLTGIRVDFDLDPAIIPTGTDQNNMSLFDYDAQSPRRASWNARDLLPPVSPTSGTSIQEMILEFIVDQPTENGQISINASALEGVSDIASAQFRAAYATEPQTPAPTLPGQEPPGQTSPTRSNTLRLTLDDDRDPVNVGRDIRYGLTIFNDRDIPARDIDVLIRIPDGVVAEGITAFPGGDPVGYQFLATDRNVIVFSEKIRSLRAGESIDFSITLRPTVAQVLEVIAQIQSQDLQEPVEASATTRVNPR